jgi:AcrR family transcriptional regulator
MSTDEGLAARQRIMTEATRLFMSCGYDGISMREIAAAAGISKPGLYYHFKDKQALLITILKADLALIGGIVRQGREQAAPVRERVGWIMEAILEHGAEIGGIMRLATQELPHLDQAEREAFGYLYQTTFTGALADLLAEGMAQGELRPVEAHTAGWALLGMVYPLFSAQPAGESGNTQAALQVMLSIFFDGLSRVKQADV